MGAGFEGAASSSVEQAFPRTFYISDFTAHQSGLVSWYQPGKPAVDAQDLQYEHGKRVAFST